MIYVNLCISKHYCYSLQQPSFSFSMCVSVCLYVCVSILLCLCTVERCYAILCYPLLCLATSKLTTTSNQICLHCERSILFLVLSPYQFSLCASKHSNSNSSGSSNSNNAKKSNLRLPLHEVIRACAELSAQQASACVSQVAGLTPMLDCHSHKQV